MSREGVQPLQDHALTQGPRADVHRGHTQPAHRGLGHHRTREKLMGSGAADAVHLAERRRGHVSNEAEHLVQAG